MNEGKSYDHNHHYNLKWILITFIFTSASNSIKFQFNLWTWRNILSTCFLASFVPNLFEFHRIIIIEFDRIGDGLGESKHSLAHAGLSVAPQE